MSISLVPGLLCQSKALLRRRRELPIEGEILVSEGQIVEADQIVGRALLPGEVHVLRVPERMGIEVREALASFELLKLEVGQDVYVDQLLCEHAGLFGLLKSQFKSPVAGKLEFISHQLGHIGVRAEPELLEVRAYMPGTVAKVQTSKAVEIQAELAIVQGIFGVGGERVGVLSDLNQAADTVIQAEMIPHNCDGLVLYGGACANIDALRVASERGAVGFISGSINDTELAEYLGYDLGVALTGDEDISMALIVTEGFGLLPMSSRVYSLLKAADGMRVSINGATQVRAGAVRPEIIVHRALDLGVESTVGLLEVGKRVRGVRVPYFGELGTVSELPSDLQRLESGVETRVAKVSFDDGRKAVVPRVNLELL